MTLSHQLRAAAGNTGGGAATPVFHYDFGDTSSWDGSSTTINDLSGNGNHTSFSNTNGLSRGGLGSAYTLISSTDYCVNRGTYTTPSGVGNNVGTGDYAIQFVWNVYLRPHGANYYYSTAQMRLMNNSSGSPGFSWLEGGILWITGVSGNAYTPAFPTPHNAASNASPAHTVNAPYPSTPATYTAGSPHRNSSPYYGYFGWEHVIITRRSGTLYVYKNGTQTASYVNNDNYSTFGGATVLGTGGFTNVNYCGYNNWFLGGLAIHKFFDVGLTDAQVTDIFNSEKSRFSL